MRLKTYTGPEVRDIRKRLGLNQTEFWANFLVTQSGGCRYESGREIPEPVQILLNLAFGPAAKSNAIHQALRQIGKPKQPSTDEATEQ